MICYTEAKKLMRVALGDIQLSVAYSWSALAPARCVDLDDGAVCAISHAAIQSYRRTSAANGKYIAIRFVLDCRLCYPIFLRIFQKGLTKLHNCVLPFIAIESLLVALWCGNFTVTLLALNCCSFYRCNTSIVILHFPIWQLLLKSWFFLWSMLK